MSGRLGGEVSDDEEMRRNSIEERTNLLHTKIVQKRAAPDSNDLPFRLCSARGRISLLLATIQFLSTLTRSSLSILVIGMAEELGWKMNQKAWFMCSFFAGYMVLQLPAVFLVRWCGSKLVTLSLLGWSVATVLVPVASQGGGFPATCCCIFVVGLLEAPIGTATSHLLTRWVATHEQAKARALVSAGTVLGSTVAALATPQLMRVDWRLAFYTYGTLGLAVMVVWTTLAASSPAESTRITPAERTYLTQHAAPSAPGGGALATLRAAGGLLCSCSVWGTFQAHLALNYVLYMFLTWLPTYMYTVCRVPINELGLYLAVPWVLYAVTQMLSCHIAEHLTRSKALPVATVRRTFQTTSFLGGALMVLAFAHTHAASLGFLCLGGIYACLGLSQAGLFSTYVDTGGKHVPVLLGLANTLATIPGVLGPMLANHFFSEHPAPSGPQGDAEPWLVLFHSASVMLCVSAIVYSACFSVPRLTQQRITPEGEEDEEDAQPTWNEGANRHNLDNSESDDDMI